MVVVRFSTMFDKIRNGIKKQTIRSIENYQHLKVGDKIHCYSTKKVEGVSRPITDELLYVGVVTDVFCVSWGLIQHITNWVRLDGFENIVEMETWFKQQYGDKLSIFKMFRIIRWK